MSTLTWVLGLVAGLAFGVAARHLFPHPGRRVALASILFGILAVAAFAVVRRKAAERDFARILFLHEMNKQSPMAKSTLGIDSKGEPTLSVEIELKTPSAPPSVHAPEPRRTGQPVATP